MAKKGDRKSGAAPVPDAVLDRIYAAPAGEFVATRNAAAKELKTAGKSEAAEAVRALRRPSAAAAAVNRAVRAEPDQAKGLLDAAGDLRRAHEAAVSGGADRDALKAATAAERQAINALSKTAARESGGSPSAELERRIRETLEAVALDEQVRDAFAAGRLQGDARATGLGFDVAEAQPPPRTPPRKRRADDRARRQAEQELREHEAALERAEDAVERRRAEAEEAAAARARADERLHEARAALREAEAEMKQARRTLERARAKRQ